MENSIQLDGLFRLLVKKRLSPKEKFFTNLKHVEREYKKNE